MIVVVTQHYEKEDDNDVSRDLNRISKDCGRCIIARSNMMLLPVL